MTKNRAAWWWIDRWRKSTAYTDMTAEQQGCYRNLLDELWLRDGVLPADDRILAKVSGDPEAWARCREIVLARFRQTPQGYRHETHDEVSSWPGSQAAKGRKRAAHAPREGGRFTSRTSPAPAGPPAKHQPGPPAQHQPPSPSPSPSPYSVSGTGTEGACGNVENSTDPSSTRRDQPTGPVPPGLDQPEPDDTPSSVNGPEPRNGRPPITPETAAAITALAFDLEGLTGAAAASWVALASTIPADHQQEMRSFDDPLARPGISEAWGQTTLRKLREMLAERRRPVPL